MRILGFTEKWPKLQQPVFTTFRLERRDRDWEVGEVAKIVYKPRSKGGGEILGLAKIINKEYRNPLPRSGGQRLPYITEAEARADGFKDHTEMWEWLRKAHSMDRLMEGWINKLTLEWGT